MSKIKYEEVIWAKSNIRKWPKQIQILESAVSRKLWL